MTSFQEALKTDSLEALRSFLKSELHNHAFGGGNRAWIASTTASAGFWKKNGGSRICRRSIYR